MRPITKNFHVQYSQRFCSQAPSTPRTIFQTPPPYNPAHFFAKHLILVPPQTRGGSSAGPPITCIAILTDNRQWSSFYLYIPRPAAIQPRSRCNRADHGVFASGTEFLILFITAPSPQGGGGGVSGLVKNPLDCTVTLANVGFRSD